MLAASVPSLDNFRVEMLELDAGGVGGEHPVDPSPGRIALALPDGNLALKL